MKTKRVTLKDVSEAAGVGLSSVHRALYDKPGVCQELKEKIIETADRMGYKLNYVASSLKRNTLKIAVVLPQSDKSPGKYYYLDVWKGIQDFKREIEEFNIELIEYIFPLDGDSQAKKLEEVYQKCGGEIDGLITVCVDEKKISYLIEKFIKKKVTVVFVVTDLPQSDRFCCVRSNDGAVGRLAAELMGNFVHQPGKILVAVGNLGESSHGYHITGFESYLAYHHKELEIVKLYHYDDQEKMEEEVEQLLKEHDDIRGLYSVVARSTLSMCKAIVATDMVGKVKMIGNDIVDENIEFLKQGVMQAIMFKNPSKQAYLSLKILFDYLVKGEYPNKSTVFYQPTIYLKSNISEFE